MFHLGEPAKNKFGKIWDFVSTGLTPVCVCVCALSVVSFVFTRPLSGVESISGNSVHMSVCLFVCHHFLFNRYLSNGRSNPKNSKNEVHFFRILLLGGPSPLSQLVPNPFNWSPNAVFTDISVSVAQIKKS